MRWVFCIFVKYEICIWSWRLVTKTAIHVAAEYHLSTCHTPGRYNEGGSTWECHSEIVTCVHIYDTTNFASPWSYKSIVYIYIYIHIYICAYMLVTLRKFAVVPS